MNICIIHKKGRMLLAIILFPYSIQAMDFFSKKPSLTIKEYQRFAVQETFNVYNASSESSLDFQIREVESSSAEDKSNLFLTISPSASSEHQLKKIPLGQWPSENSADEKIQYMLPFTMMQSLDAAWESMPTDIFNPDAGDIWNTITYYKLWKDRQDAPRNKRNRRTFFLLCLLGSAVTVGYTIKNQVNNCVIYLISAGLTCISGILFWKACNVAKQASDKVDIFRTAFESSKKDYELLERVMAVSSSDKSTLLDLGLAHFVCDNEGIRDLVTKKIESYVLQENSDFPKKEDGKEKSKGKERENP